MYVCTEVHVFVMRCGRVLVSFSVSKQVECLKDLTRGSFLSVLFRGVLFRKRS